MRGSPLSEHIATRAAELVRSLSEEVVEHATAEIIAAIESSLALGVAAVDTPRERRPGENRPRRSRRELAALALRVHRLVAERPGLTVGELAEALGLETADLATPLRWLKNHGVVTVSGITRSATYRLTDREWSPQEVMAALQARRARRPPTRPPSARAEPLEDGVDGAGDR